MHQKRTLLKALTYMWKLHSCSHRSKGGRAMSRGWGVQGSEEEEERAVGGTRVHLLGEGKYTAGLQHSRDSKVDN